MFNPFFFDLNTILYIEIEKFEHFDEKDCEIIFVENIWFFDVAKRIDETSETNETNEQIIADFSIILYNNFV